MEIKITVKRILYIILGFSFLIAFSSSIESLFGTNTYFSWLWNVKSALLLDILILLLLLLYTSLKIEECKTEIPNKTFSYFIFLTILFYTYEKFCTSYFTFTPFKFSTYGSKSHYIAYLDIIYWFGFLHFGAYLKYFQTEESIPTIDNLLLEDAPINSQNEDGLDGLYNIPAKKIYKIIKENKFESSFTIGLNGEWGDGKTSVFNLVKNKLREDNQLVTVDFNPWMGFDKKVLIKDFFNSLSESLGSSFSKELSEYTNEILDNGEENSFVKIIQSFLRNKDESLISIYNDINDKIGNLDKKIVVFIDDVDRLDKEEVFEILKLIRKTANFKNTFFVLAYDRNYVNNSIKDQSGSSTIKYLDKIINAEISLPYFDKYALKEYFIENLKKVIPSQFHTKIDYFIKSYEKDPLSLDLGFDENDLFLYWINNFREIKKVINAIVINYSGIYQDVNLVDVVNLEILKLKHPQIYAYLYVKQTELFVVNRATFCYDFAPIDMVKAREQRFLDFLESRKETFDSNSEKKSEIPTVLDYYLDQYINENKINDIEKEKILDLLSRLFSKSEEKNDIFLGNNMEQEQKLSVKFVNMFERYFAHTIFANNISENEFNLFLSLNQSQIKDKIGELSGLGKIKDLTFRLNQKFDYEDVEKYKNTLIALFIISNQENNLVDFQNIIGKMFGMPLYPNIFSTKEDAVNFFKSLFDSDYADPHFKSRLLNELRNRNRRRQDENDSERFPLSNDEIEILLENFIKEEIKEELNFSKGFWNLYFICQRLNINGSKTPFLSINNTILEKIKEEKIQNEFLKSLIVYDGYGYESVIRREAIENLFDSFENFEKTFLDNLSVSDYNTTFKEYYQKSKENNWEPIEFEYEFIELSIPDDSRYVINSMIKK